jgi:hypothetical protein
MVASRYCSLPVMSPFTVRIRMPASLGGLEHLVEGVGAVGRNGDDVTPRWICASMNGICEVASAVAGATNSKFAADRSQASSKPPVIESKYGLPVFLPI